MHELKPGQFHIVDTEASQGGYSEGGYPVFTPDELNSIVEKEQRARMLQEQLAKASVIRTSLPSVGDLTMSF